MLHFLRMVTAVAAQDRDAIAAPRLRNPWLFTAFASILVPWALYMALPMGTLADVLAPKALWESLWPVLVGAALAWLLARSGDRLPRIPAGDIAVVIEGLRRTAAVVGVTLERIDGGLRRWPVASIALPALVVVLGVALASG
jgi:hypothetical protein